MRKLLFIFCTLALTACSLEENPRDQIPEEEAFKTKRLLFENTVATLYNYIGGNVDGEGLQGTCRGVYDLQTFGSDEAMLPIRGADWYDGGLWVDMYKHSWNAGHEFVKNAWLYLYKVIALCNRSLSKLEAHRQLADRDYESWNAEIRALRAMFYWYLIDLYGDVPLITSPDVSMNEVTRNPRKEVFNFCIKELEECIPLLYYENSVSEGEYYGRMTIPVARFVLVKLLLNSAVYTGSNDVNKYYEACIQHCKYFAYMFELQRTMADNFAVNNQYSKENIFVIPMDKNIYTNLQSNINRSIHYRHADAFGFKAENGTCATLKTMEIFGYDTNSEDLRIITTFFIGKVFDQKGEVVLDRMGEPLEYYPDKVKLDLTGSKYVETAGARMYKYEIDKNAFKDGKLVDNDIVLFRYADVLLMMAEAKVRLGQSGQKELDMIRERSLMETIPCTLDNILNERMLELCWEGWRRQDLVSFGKYKSLYMGTDAVDESDGHTTLFPIPSDVRTANPKLTQNPGY